MPLDAEALRSRLEAAGFDVVRFARADRAPRAEEFRAWLEAGYQADMTWIDRTVEKRGAPEQVLPGARSLILLGVNYGPGRAPADGAANRAGSAVHPMETRRPRRVGLGDVAPEAPTEASELPVQSEPVWARYALHTDYHDTMKPGLQAAGRILEDALALGPQDYRYYVDTGPVLERGWAARAGVGFVGKNAMMISREFGNWLFLASILVRAELPADPPLSPRALADEAPGLLCGKCTRCLDACPTEAFPRPGVVDARRCISYQTIENKGVIPRELRRGIGARIYGCDTCLEVCPWNRFAQAGRSLLLEARPEIAALSLREILELTPERFADRFRGTAMKRLKLRGLLRNACIVAANTGAVDCLDRLASLASHPEPVVRAHAVWAVRVLGGAALLSAARAAESDPRVLDEYAGELENAPAPL